MKKLATLVCLLLVVAPAWPQSKNIHESVDPYTGLSTLLLEVSTRTCQGDPSPGLHDPQVHLLFTAMQNKDHTVSYFISPELDQASYTLSLRPKGTIDTLIDGAPGSFSTPSGSTTTNQYVGDHSYLHETIPFSVSQADLVKLSTAQWFQFRINGQRQAVQRCIDAKRMRDLAEFIDAASDYGPPPQFGIDTHSKPLVEKVSASTSLKELTYANIPTQSCPGDPAPSLQDADIHLSISANQHSDGAVWYYISTEVPPATALNLPRGGTMQAQMDGKSTVFRSIDGSRVSYAPDATGQSTQHETTAFHVHQPDLVALTEADMLEFRVTGSDGTIHRCVHPDRLKYLSDFIRIAAQYQPPHIAATSSPAAH